MYGKAWSVMGMWWGLLCCCCEKAQSEKLAVFILSYYYKSFSASEFLPALFPFLSFSILRSLLNSVLLP